ncbi:CBS domain-containing protein [Nonomuraea fuscirosea]|uniref:CBS domain-containing protein n=1 Tax=Nonomuraea fuscirosea TaxID=1291556 RepID=UPI0033E41BBE
MRRTVADVMTDKVVAVSAATPFKEIAETLISGGISAVPVTDDDNHVLGMVSEADLLRKEEFREQYYREGYRPPLRARLRHPKGRQKAEGDTAAELMTTPAVTVSPKASARLMDGHGVKRLVVVDYDGRLVGIVSRRDLVKLFLRGDEAIAAEVRDDVLDRSLWVDTGDVRVDVRQGVVTLSGRMERRTEAAIAVRMVGRVNGVVDVVDRLTWKTDDSKWEGR